MKELSSSILLILKIDLIFFLNEKSIFIPRELNNFINLDAILFPSLSKSVRIAADFSSIESTTFSKVFPEISIIFLNPSLLKTYLSFLPSTITGKE